MDKQLARYLADFNRPRYEWWDGETPGVCTAMVVVAVLALVVFLVGR